MSKILRHPSAISDARDALERSLFVEVAARSFLHLHLRSLLAARYHEKSFDASGGLTLEERMELAEDADFLLAGLLEVLSGRKRLQAWERNCLRLPHEAAHEEAAIFGWRTQ